MSHLLACHHPGQSSLHLNPAILCMHVYPHQNTQAAMCTIYKKAHSLPPLFHSSNLDITAQFKFSLSAPITPTNIMPLLHFHPGAVPGFSAPHVALHLYFTAGI